MCGLGLRPNFSGRLALSGGIAEQISGRPLTRVDRTGGATPDTRVCPVSPLPSVPQKTASEI